MDGKDRVEIMEDKKALDIYRYMNFSELSLEEIANEEISKRIEEAPEHCPITGLKKIKSYCFGEGVVYSYEGAYDAFTLPYYDETGEAFYRVKIDMDDDFRRQDEYVCDLKDLREREDFEEIKKLYGIIE